MRLKGKAALGLLLFAAISFALAIPVLAQTTTATDITEPEQQQTEYENAGTDSDARLALAISNAYQISVSAEEVSNLRSNNFGYGEIALAYGLSQLSGKAVGDIVAMRQEQLGWGEIAHSLGVKLSDATLKCDAALKAANMEQERNRMREMVKAEERNQKGKTQQGAGSRSDSGKGSNQKGKTK